MEVSYDSGNFRIIGEEIYVPNLEVIRDNINKFMVDSKASVEQLDVRMFKKHSFPGYYEYLTIVDKYFLKGNIFQFSARTDLIQDCYNNASYQNPEDRGINIIKKDGRIVPKYTPIIGRYPKLSDPGFFRLFIQGYKELPDSKEPSVNELLKGIFPKDLSKKLKLE